MTDRTDVMAQALFNKPSLEACSLQQVDYLAHQYPYFTAAQILLLQKADGNQEASAVQLQRTALHVANPMQLQYWLDAAAFETTLPETKLFQKPIPDKQIEVDVHTEKQEAETEPEIEREKAPETETIATEETGEIVERAIQEETETESRNDTSKEEPIVERAAIEIVAEEQPVMPLAETQTDVATFPVPETKVETTTPITFEPYHTVDYFASQGIRLSQQEATNDKLGKQLKSFTEWLKTMKRLPESAPEKAADSATERKVEHLAAHSLDTSEVLTESMAEVWLKQGSPAKAAEVYNKLRLRHPAKSAYFAAKIESLKKS